MARPVSQGLEESMLSHFPCKYWIRCSTSYQACLAWAYVRPAGLSYSPCLLSHHLLAFGDPMSVSVAHVCVHLSTYM